MKVVSIGVLDKYMQNHADSKNALSVWLSIAQKATWRNLLEVRRTYPHADYVRPFTVFNIKGKSYRLITIIDYDKFRIAIDSA